MAEKEAAERANLIKTEFINIASHEIRTPLHSIFGYTELLSQTQLTSDQATYIEAIKTGCETIQLITNNVLDFTKLERGNAESRARPVEVDLKRLAENVVRSCAPKQRVGVDLVCWVQDTVPSIVHVDEIYITRVLMNLVSNALKFTASGYVLLWVEAQTDADDCLTLVLTVRDTGIGIPSDSIGVIFEPFRQADTSLTRKHTGTEAECTNVGKATAALKAADVILGDVEVLTEAQRLRGEVASTKKLTILLYDEGESVLDLRAFGEGVVWEVRPVIVHRVEGILRQGRIGRAEEAGPSLSTTIAIPANGHRDLGQRGGSNGRSVSYDVVAPSPSLETNPPSTSASESRGNILLVEDNLINQKLGQRLLEKLNYKAALASDGLEAVQMILTFDPPFDVVLMDCQMPIMSGTDATRKIRELEREGRLRSDSRGVGMAARGPKRLPIVALTANVSEESRAECQEAGMDIFLPKPLKMKDLEGAIQKMLGKIGS
ncbi:hypothetical protein HDV00_009532 [Rhizophlyctis rosea]|nr:hypothetical protein HDV00_009532 [Rhizophlyctis rosea]